MNRIRVGVLAALGLLVACGWAAPQAPAPGYRVVKTFAVGGEGGWDYLTLDAEARRLYVARATRVQVLDADKGTPIGEVANTPGVHGVALVPKRDRGFASNGRDGSVTVFDLKTLRETARIKVGNNPDAILYDPSCGRVFTSNGGSHDMTAIDAETEKVVGTIALGGRPEAAVADGKGNLFVNIEDKNELVELDGRALTVKHRWPLAPGKTPTGLALDPVRRRLFSACRSEHLVVLDADSGRVLATPPIGKGTDGSEFDPVTQLAFASNGDGTLTIVRADDKGAFAVVQTVKTQPSAKTMALDPKTHNVYLAAARAKPGQPRSYEPGSFVILVVGK
jgi:YVTN family beta-propeller protein